LDGDFHYTSLLTAMVVKRTIQELLR